MARHGIVEPATGEVINVIVWEGAEWLPPRGKMVIQHDKIDIGDKWDDDNKNLIKRFFLAIEPKE